MIEVKDVIIQAINDAKISLLMSFPLIGIFFLSFMPKKLLWIVHFFTEVYDRKTILKFIKACRRRIFLKEGIS